MPNWPKEYGGTGWSSTQKFIFEMEMARADLPYLSSFSLKMAAPVLMRSAAKRISCASLPYFIRTGATILMLNDER